MLQAALQDGVSLDPLALEQDGLTSSGEDVGGRQVAQAFMVAPVIVVLDEGVDLGLKVARQVVVFQQNSILQRLMPALDLTLRHWVIRSATAMLHAAAFEPFRQIAGDVARPIVRQKPGPMNDIGLIKMSSLQGHVQSLDDIAGALSRARRYPRLRAGAV